MLFTFLILVRKKENNSLEMNHWELAKTSGVSPIGRAFHACSQVGHNIYVFGGYSGCRALQDIYILDTGTVFLNFTDLESLTWTNPLTRGPIPTPRFEHTMTSVGNFIVLFGGGSENSWLNDVFILDTGTISYK